MKNFFMNLITGFFGLLGRIIRASLDGFGNVLVAMTAGLFAGLTGIFSSRLMFGLLLLLVGLVVFNYSNQDVGGLLGLIGVFIALFPKKKCKQKRRKG